MSGKENTRVKVIFFLFILFKDIYDSSMKCFDSRRFLKEICVIPECDEMSVYLRILARAFATMFLMSDFLMGLFFLLTLYTRCEQEEQL